MNAADLKRDILGLVARYAEATLAPTPFQPGTTAIPPAGKVLDGDELRLMVEASLDAWLTTGRFNDEFEARLAAYLGVRHVSTVNSGSSANLVAVSTLTSPKLGERRIQPGDEVITVAAGFPTTVNPILQVGAVPVFVDVEIPGYNIDCALLEAALSPRTKAVVLAHTLGNPFNLAEVQAFCARRRLWLVEDCCDALGSTYDGRKVGTFGDLATLSFYPAHHITMGEGGAVLTNNPQLKLIADSFRDWGRDCWCPPGKDATCGRRYRWQLGDLPFGYDHKYTYSHLGYNLKITDMQAACGLAQLGKLERFVAARKQNFRYLTEQLSWMSDFAILPRATENSDPSWFGFPLTVRETVSRAALLEHLERARVGTRLLFGGNLTRQPYMAGRTYRVASPLRNTDVVMERTFWFGVYPGLDQERLDYVVQQLKAFFRR